MNKSTPSSQYFVQPPDVPMFLAGRPSNLRGLIQWAKDEHQRAVIISTKKGLWKTLDRLSKEYSPIRVLAEMHEFRRICANIKKSDWDALTGRERVFIRRAFELRDLLLRQN